MNKNIIIGLSIFFFIISSLNVLAVTDYSINDPLTSLNAALWTNTGGTFTADGYFTGPAESDYLASVKTNYGSMSCTIEAKVGATLSGTGKVGFYSSTTTATMIGYDATKSTTNFAYGNYTNTVIGGAITAGSFTKIGWFYNGTTAQQYKIGTTIYNLTGTHASVGQIYIGLIGAALAQNVTYKNVLCWNGSFDEQPAEPVAPSNISITILTNNATAYTTLTPSINFSIPSITGTFNLSVIVNGTSKGILYGINTTGTYNLTTSPITNFNTFLSWYISGMDAINSSTVINSSTYYFAILNSTTTSTSTSSIKLCNFVVGSIALKDASGCY
jgi:hypothetical protein